MEMSFRYKLLIRSAKKRGIEVNLNTQFYKDLIKMGCLYCGDSLEDKTGTCLDRHDNSKGYTNGNAVGCCHICNYAKRTLGSEDFYSWVIKAYKHQNKCHDSVAFQNVYHSGKAEKENKKMTNIYFNMKKVKNAEVLIYNP